MGELVRLAKEALRQQKAFDPIPTPTLQPGNRITWQRADGKVTEGVIDFLHAYSGEVRAFCTLLDDRWCAVNTRYAKKGDTTHD